MSKEKRIEEYIQQVCLQIRNKDVHASISLELESHLADKIEDYESQGYDEENAITQAIADMGDPEQVGKQLHHAHKPRMEWSVIAIVAVLIGFGLLVMYSLSSTQSANHLSGWSFFENKVIGTLLGLSLFLAVLFGDYRKWQRFSKHLYFCTIFLMYLTLLQNRTINGVPYLDLGILYLDISSISTLLLTIALAGMFIEWNWESRWTLIKAFAAFVVPFIFLLSSFHLLSAFCLTIGFSVLVFTSTIRKKAAFTLISLIAGFTFYLVYLVYFFNKPYHMNRITAFLDPYADPLGTGYVYVQSIKILQSAGLWGNGIGASLEEILPASPTDFIFTYIVHSFGLVTGATIMLLGVILLVRLLKALKGLRDRYGLMLMSGLIIFFFVPFFWSIVMTMGIVPITSVNLPFISHGNSQFLMQMLLIGLILNIYRNKDLHLWSDNSDLSKNP